MKKLLLGSISLAVLVSAQPALAGHYKGEAVYKDMYVAAPLWTGFYAGLNAGYGWSTQSVKLSSTATVGGITDPITIGALPSSLAKDPSGWLGGVQVGYNYQYCQTVFGVEADFQWTGINESETIVSTVAPLYTTYAKQELDYFGTLRARIGMTPSVPSLIYVTGGLAGGHTELKGSVIAPDCTTAFCAADSKSGNEWGWVLGVGGEYMFDTNWSVKAEYLYYDLGNTSQTLVDATFPGESVRQKVDFKGNIVRLGVNYKFG